MRKLVLLCLLGIFAIGGSAQKRHLSSKKSSSSSSVKKTPPHVSDASGQVNGTGFVDLGLSVNWSLTNLGATFNTQVGGEYLWGNPNKQKKGVYKEDKSIENSYPRGTGVMRLEADAAHKALGGTWRVPTKNDYQELEKKCTWRWVTGTGNDGKKYNGYIVTGPNGNSIFLPRPVCRCREYEECNTFYMLSTYSRDGFFLGDRFSVDSDNSHYMGNYSIAFGYYIRPVCDKD